jgi:hypothetical protein
MVVFIFLLLIGGFMLLAMVWNASAGVDNDPFYMGDGRDELWIDYCKVCGKRHDGPRCEGG